jgi:hypothetical protein
MSILKKIFKIDYNEFYNISLNLNNEYVPLKSFNYINFFNYINSNFKDESCLTVLSRYSSLISNYINKTNCENIDDITKYFNKEFLNNFFIPSTKFINYDNYYNSDYNEIFLFKSLSNPINYYCSSLYDKIIQRDYTLILEEGLLYVKKSDNNINVLACLTINKKYLQFYILKLLVDLLFSKEDIEKNSTLKDISNIFSLNNKLLFKFYINPILIIPNYDNNNINYLYINDDLIEKSNVLLKECQKNNIPTQSCEDLNSLLLVNNYKDIPSSKILNIDSDFIKDFSINDIYLDTLQIKEDLIL